MSPEKNYGMKNCIVHFIEKDRWIGHLELGAPVIQIIKKHEMPPLNPCFFSKLK